MPIKTSIIREYGLLGYADRYGSQFSYSQCRHIPENVIVMFNVNT